MDPETAANVNTLLLLFDEEHDFSNFMSKCDGLCFGNWIDAGESDLSRLTDIVPADDVAVAGDVLASRDNWCW